MDISDDIMNMTVSEFLDAAEESSRESQQLAENYHALRVSWSVLLNEYDGIHTEVTTPRELEDYRAQRSAFQSSVRALREVLRKL